VAALPANVKKQLFDQKSKKRYGQIVDVTQLSRGEAMEDEHRAPEKTITV